MNVLFTRAYYPWYRFDKIVLHFIRDLQCAYQRITKGYCYRDTWAISDWFIQIMPNMIQDLKDNAHGYFGNSKEEWDAILDQIIFCLKEGNEDSCSQQNEYKDTFPSCMDLKVMVESDSLQMVELPMTEEQKENKAKWFKRECELSSYRNEKTIEGLELFKSHFNELWD